MSDTKKHPKHLCKLRKKGKLDELAARSSAPRITCNKCGEQLWSQHKYSVLARDPQLYRSLGPKVATIDSEQGTDQDLAVLAQLLCETLRTRPPQGRLKNALLHMWGYISEVPPSMKDQVETWDLKRLLTEIQQRTQTRHEPYLTASTALSELGAWLEASPPENQPPLI